MPIASFTRLAGANGSSIIAGKAVWRTRRGKSGREVSKEMRKKYSRSILVTNSQSNTATHHLQTYARAMDSEVHIIRTANYCSMLPPEKQF